MFSTQTVLLACLVVGGLSGGGAGWYFHGVGRQAERNEWLELETQRTDTALETARIAAAAQTRATAVSETRHVAIVARAQGIKREIVYLPRSDCEWADDERLRLEALHHTYFGTADPPVSVHGGLRTAPETDITSDVVGGADVGLGLRLPAAAP